MENTIRKVVYKSKFLDKILAYFLNCFQLKILAVYKDKEIVELIKNKSLPVIELSGSQCMIIKIE